MAPLPLILIRWLDAASDSTPNWVSLDELREQELVEVRSVGWLIYEDDFRITIASHITESEMADGDLTVPKSWLKERTELLECPDLRLGDRV